MYIGCLRSSSCNAMSTEIILLTDKKAKASNRSFNGRVTVSANCKESQCSDNNICEKMKFL